ncbi:MAG TPA: hypothetical protein VN646_18940 [Candidatus Acidoferrum sp.]|jgi:hypothetical protein|nr:hypothetical protein [Candidatus Acidoferrum sp.]
MRVRRWSRGALGVVALLAALGACASGGGSGRTAGGGAAGAPVAVTDLKSVAGRWVGLMDVPGNSNEDQYLEVTVREDGTYRAKSARTIGVMDAQGTIAVSDGRLLLRGERGSRGTATLFSKEGGSTLMVDMTAPNQSRTTARLRPQP